MTKELIIVKTTKMLVVTSHRDKEVYALVGAAKHQLEEEIGKKFRCNEFWLNSNKGMEDQTKFITTILLLCNNRMIRATENLYI